VKVLDNDLSCSKVGPELNDIIKISLFVLQEITSLFRSSLKMVMLLMCTMLRLTWWRGLSC
jgi:hypothetical protein